MNVMRRSRRRITGLVVAVAAVTCIGLSAVGASGTATAASAPAVAAGPGVARLVHPGTIVPLSGSVRAAASAACVLFPSTTDCTSSDPKLSVQVENNTDTTGCEFTYLIKWGDGASNFGSVPGGPAGTYTLVTHTYTAPATYTVSMTGTVVTGDDCTFTPGTGYFTYTGPAVGSIPKKFTVKGSLPVTPSTSQDTHAQVPGSVCDEFQLQKYRAEAFGLVDPFFVAHFAFDAVTLLNHFLDGTGTPINFPDKSTPSNDLLKNSEFNNLNQRVQDAMVEALNRGATTVNLGSHVLERIPLYSPSDLHYSFGGTQGLIVTGSGRLSGGDYVGTLTYKIEDSYGFSTKDIFFLNMGTKLRYLQTVCGNPPNSGGARWFPDSVTITVPFKLQSLLA